MIQKFGFSILVVGVLALSLPEKNWARDGVAGGNTSIHMPRNERGEEIRIRFEAKHPKQDEILEALLKYPVPLALQLEMIKDFETTAAIFTTETVRLKDLQRQMMLRLARVVETTETDSDGKEKKSVQKEYTAVDIGSRLGIYIEALNLHAQNLEDSLVAAYTELAPRRAFYFETTFQQMNEDQLWELVLHEQAHRLAYFEKYRNDERTVMGIARNLREYLQGKKTREAFEAELTRLKLPLISNLSFDQETLVHVESSLYESQLFLTVAPTQLLGVDVVDKMAIAQLPSEVFKGFPAFQAQVDRNYWDLKLMPVHGDPDYKLARQYLERVRGGNEPARLEARVHFRKTPLVDSNGLRTSKYEITSIAFDPSEGRAALLGNLKRSIEEHFTALDVQFEARSEQALFLTRNGPVELLSLFERIRSRLALMASEKPDLYSFIRNHIKRFVLNKSARSQHELTPCGRNTTGITSDLMVNLNFESIDEVTDQEIENLFSCPQQLIEPYYKKLVNERNDWDAIAKQYSVLIHSNPEVTAADYERFIGFIKRNTQILSFFSRFIQIGSYRHGWEPKFNLNFTGFKKEPQLTWNYTSNNTLHLNFPEGILEQPGGEAALTSFILNTLVTDRILEKDDIMRNAYHLYIFHRANWVADQRQFHLLTDVRDYHKVNITPVEKYWAQKAFEIFAEIKPPKAPPTQQNPVEQEALPQKKKKKFRWGRNNDQ